MTKSHKLLAKLFAAAALYIVLVVSGVWATLWVMGLVESRVAASLGTDFLLSSRPVTEELYEEWGIERALQTSDDLAFYFLVRAAEFDREEGTAAYRFLALYFLTHSDCEMAIYYLQKRHERVSLGRISAEMLDLLQEQPCTSKVVREALKMTGYDWLADRVD